LGGGRKGALGVAEPGCPSLQDHLVRVFRLLDPHAGDAQKVAATPGVPHGESRNGHQEATPMDVDRPPESAAAARAPQPQPQPCAATLAYPMELTGHTQPVYALDWSPEEQFLLSGSGDGMVGWCANLDS
jgi:hypothetical protein